MAKKNVDEDGYQIYMKHIRNIPVLSKRQEQFFAKRAREGDKSAKEKLIVSNLNFLVRIASKYRKMGLPLMDLINEGNLGLIRAAEKFEDSRGVKFITYARWWIRHYILKAIHEKSALIRIPYKNVSQMAGGSVCEGRDPMVERKTLSSPVSIYQKQRDIQDSGTIIDILEGEEYESPDKSFLEKEFKESILKSMESLRPRERDVVVQHFGLNGTSP